MILNTSCASIFRCHLLRRHRRRHRPCRWPSSGGVRVALAWAPSILGLNHRRMATTVYAPSSAAATDPGRTWFWLGSAALWTPHLRLCCPWRTSPQNRSPSPPPPGTMFLRTGPVDSKIYSRHFRRTRNYIIMHTDYRVILFTALIFSESFGILIF